MSERCKAAIYKRDQYRVARDGKRRFRMHYKKERCSRQVRAGGDFCTQHHEMLENGRVLERLDWD